MSGKALMWDLEEFGSEICLTGENGDNYTYYDVANAGTEISKHVGMRCLVFLMCRNVPESVIGYISFINHGIVPAMLASNMDESLIERLVHIYEPSFFWAPEDIVTVIDNLGYRSVYSFGSYRLFEAQARKEYRIHEDLCVLLTTSGSTGSPKFVRQTYRNVFSNAEAIAEYLKLDRNERPITTLPMNYTYGLSIINSHLLKGARILVTEKGIMQKEFWDFFRNFGATSFGGVPYTYEMLDKLRLYKMDLPSLSTMTQAGGKLSVKLHEKMAEFAFNTGRKFFVMYGQCEATARMGFLPPERSLEKKGSMGIAIPGGRFTLIDEGGNVITTPGVTGELIYEGDNVTPGYAECRDDLSLGDERHGRLETGDMAYFDDEGYYYISGRKNRFLKMFGNRVNLDETERLIKDRFSIRTACTGYDDHMYIFLTDEKIRDEVKNYVSDMTHIHRSAFKVHVLDEIPMTGSGKTKYAGLEKYYDNR